MRRGQPRFSPRTLLGPHTHQRPSVPNVLFQILMAPAVRYNEKLSKGTAFAYSFLRTAVSGFDLTVRPARTSVYTQAHDTLLFTCT